MSAGGDAATGIPRPYELRDDGLVLRLLVTPKARRPGLLGLRGDPPALRVAVAAPPEDGRANAAVEALIAELTLRPRSAVTLIAGASARIKRLHVAGDGAAIAAVLDRHLDGLARA